MGNPSPTPKRFPETLKISRGWSPREISRAEGMDFPIPPEFWWITDILLIVSILIIWITFHPCSTKTREVLYQYTAERILILTLSILPCLEGWISWSIPRDRIDDEENVRTPPKLGRNWEIHPLRPRDFPRASPSENLLGLGKSLGRRGWIFQYLPRLGGAWIQSFPADDERMLITFTMYDIVNTTFHV